MAYFGQQTEQGGYSSGVTAPSAAPSTSPVDWTEEQQQLIAKIGTADSDLAQSLSARLQGKEATDGSYMGGLVHALSGAGGDDYKGGFFSDLWNTVTAPVRGAGHVLTHTPVVREAVDLISRPLYAISEATRNELAAGEADADPVWEDIWQGLSGKTKTSFVDTFSSWAAMGPSGLLSPLAGESYYDLESESQATRTARFKDWKDRSYMKALGFAADVAADPLTYVIPFGKNAAGTVQATRTAKTITEAGADWAMRKGLLSVERAERIRAASTKVAYAPEVAEEMTRLSSQVDELAEEAAMPREDFVRQYGQLPDELDIEIRRGGDPNQPMGGLPGIDSMRKSNFLPKTGTPGVSTSPPVAAGRVEDLTGQLNDLTKDLSALGPGLQGYGIARKSLNRVRSGLKGKLNDLSINDALANFEEALKTLNPRDPAYISMQAKVRRLRREIQAAVRKERIRTVVHRTDDGHINGVLEVHLDEAGNAIDMHAVVDPAFRGQGIGTRLAHEAIDQFDLAPASKRPMMTPKGAALFHTAAQYKVMKHKVRIQELAEQAGQQVIPTAGDIAYINTKLQGFSDEFAEAMAWKTEVGAEATLIRNVDDIIHTKKAWAGHVAGNQVAQHGALSALNDAAKFFDPFGDAWTGAQLKQFVKDARSFRPQQAPPGDHWLHRMYRGAGTKVTRKGKEIPLTDELLSRRAAATFGGARAQVSLPFPVRRWARRNGHPFFAYRYTFKMHDYGAGNPFRGVSRFFRGNSQLHKLEGMMNNPEIAFHPRDFAVWQNKGYSGLKAHMENTGRSQLFNKYLGNRANSILMPLSERVGQFTASTTRGADLWRRFGTTGVELADISRRVKSTQKGFKQWGLQHAPAWAKAAQRLTKEEGQNLDEVLDDSVQFLEQSGTEAAEALAKIPEYLHTPLKQMKEMFILAPDKLRELGVDVGDFTRVLAAKRALDTYGIMRRQLRRIDEEVEALKPRIELGDLDARNRYHQLLAERDEFQKGLKQVSAGVTPKAQGSKAADSIKKLGGSVEDRLRLYDEWYARSGGDVKVLHATPTNYFHLMFTPEARRALLGDFDPKDPVHSQRAAARRRQIDDFERQLVHGRADAEKQLRTGEFGKRLGGVDKVFENDIFSVYARYIDKWSDAVFTASFAKGVGSILKEVSAVDNGLFTRIAPDAADKVDQFMAGDLNGAMELQELFDKVAPGLPLKPNELPLEAQRRYAKVAKAYNGMVAEVMGLKAPVQAAWKNADEVDPRLWRRIEIPGFEGLYGHPYIVTEMHRTWKGLKDPGEVMQAWRRVNTMWKRAATIYWYGFHWRNNMGAFFNNFVGRGTDVVDDYADGFKLLHAYIHPRGEWGNKTWRKNVIIDGQLRDRVTYGQLKDMMDSQGIFQANGLMTGEFYSHLPSKFTPMAGGSRHSISNWVTERMIKKATGGRTPMVSLPTLRFNATPDKLARPRVNLRSWEVTPEAFFRAAERHGTQLALGTENLHRTAAWLGGLAEGGGDTNAARAYSMMRHGDYEDLTDTEDSIRDVIPFFKWTRTNVPYQLRNLFERPGTTILPFEKLKYAMVSREDRERLPEWMADKFLVPLPGHGELPKNKQDAAAWFMLLDLPAQDIYMSGREFVSGALPLVKPFFENMMGEQVYTGIPLEGRPEKLSGWMHTIGLDNVLESAGIGERDADGDLTVSDRTINVLNILPMFGKFRNFLSGDENRKALRMNAFMSMMSGMGARPTTWDDLNEEEMRFFYDVVKPAYEHLKDLGYEFPTAADTYQTSLIVGGSTRAPATGVVAP